MPGAEQTNPIAWAIHDEGKKVGNVAAEYAHVQGFQFRKGSELSAKDCNSSVVTS